VCFRWVDDNFETHEDFVGLQSVDDITAATILHVVTDAVCRMTLSLSMCRAQCYNGASNMKLTLNSLNHKHFTCIAIAIA